VAVDWNKPFSGEHEVASGQDGLGIMKKHWVDNICDDMLEVKQSTCLQIYRNTSGDGYVC
jgi:hypothetical protein